MFNDFQTFYRENALAAFQEYRDRRAKQVLGRNRDIRLAMIATEAMFHLREYLPSTAALTRLEAQAACPDYRILADTCNASKHKKLSRPTPGNLPPLVDEASRIIELMATIFYEDELGEYLHHEKLVQVELTDGSHRDVLEILTNVANFFEQHLKARGVFANARTFKYLDPYRFRTRGESSGLKMDMEINQEVGVSQQFQLLRFNNKNGKVEPIDLTECTISGKIYKPQFDFDLSMTHNATGKQYYRTVTIEGIDAIKLAKIETELEQNEYAAKLPSVIAAQNEIIAEFSANHPECVFQEIQCKTDF